MERQNPRAHTRTNISAQQALAILKALGPQSRLRAYLEPTVQILIECLLGRADIPSKIALTHHLDEMSLRVAKASMDCLADVFALFRFGIAANTGAHHIGARAAADDLAGFSGHWTPPVLERHTCGARGRAKGLGSWELQEGRLIGVQTQDGRLQVLHPPRAAFTLAWEPSPLDHTCSSAFLLLWIEHFQLDTRHIARIERDKHNSYTTSCGKTGVDDWPRALRGQFSAQPCRGRIDERMGSAKVQLSAQGKVSEV